MSTPPKLGKIQDNSQEMLQPQGRGKQLLHRLLANLEQGSPRDRQKVTEYLFGVDAEGNSHAAESSDPMQHPLCESDSSLPMQHPLCESDSSLPMSNFCNDHLTSEDFYYDCYGRFHVQEEILKDNVWATTYQNAINNNKHLFRGKTVLDIGCGTGLLCLFAAKAGARKVYGIDSSSIVELAEKIVEKNHLGDVISIIRGKVEEVTLPVDKVDIIVSEWMGYCLFYEMMLETIFYARDKWLKEDGIIFPDKASLFVCAIEDQHYKHNSVDWWHNVHGFDMSCVCDTVISKPLIRCINPTKIRTDARLLKEINLYTATKDDLQFSTEFSLRVFQDGFIHALLTFFNIEFTKCHTSVGFSTSPRAPYTHWKQTAFYFDSFISAKKSEEVLGVFSLKALSKKDLEIKVGIEFTGKICEMTEKITYSMN